MWESLKIFFVFLLISISMDFSAQESQLVYKTVTAGICLNFNTKANEGFVIKYNWAYNPVAEIGIWDTDIRPTIYGDTVYRSTVVIYNDHLQPLSTLFLTSSSVGDLYVRELDDVIYNFRNNGLVGNQFTKPAVSDNLYTAYNQDYLLRYQATENSCTGMLNFSHPAINTLEFEPFRGFFASAYGSPGHRNFRNTNVGALLSDNLFISFFELSSEQTLNALTDFTAPNNQESLVRVVYDLDNDTYSSAVIGSNTGSQRSFITASNHSGQALYRIGLVRGYDTPVSLSGAQLPMNESDSLYHVFLTKESAEGETDWLTEMYAYNNSGLDTVIGFGQPTMLNDFYTLLEYDGSLFISSSFASLLSTEDTLLFRDFTDQETFHYNELDIQQSPSWLQPKQVPMSQATLFKIDTLGNIQKQLSFSESLFGEELHIYLGYRRQNKLFKVGEKLAWVHSYSAVNDTVATFFYTFPDGMETSTELEFPAGKGSIILWLNSELEILDKWIITYSAVHNTSMVINAVTPYHGDTLLIQGNMKSGVSTTLDPFGQAEQFTTADESTFFAFYSAPDILSTSAPESATFEFSIFPNPSYGQLSLTGLNDPKITFCIYDVSGRIVQSGNLPMAQSLDISHLNPGMYILNLKSQRGKGARKFIRTE